MRNGVATIDPVWTAPLHGKLKTTIFGVDTVEIDTLVEKTMKHMPQ
jgi:hypothetical protein